MLILDDSLSHKPHTNENEPVTWHLDHSCDRSVKGINFGSALYHTTGTAVPVSFEVVTKPKVVIDPKSGRPRRRAEETKNEKFRRLVRACGDNQIPFRYVLNDVWYASVENMTLIHTERHKRFVMPLKPNRSVALSEADRQAKQYVPLDALTWQEGRVRRRIWPKGLTFPVVVT